MDKAGVKGCLKSKILQTRPGITWDFEPKPMYPLTEEEKVKERKRKESNRRSAARSRQKQKEQDEQYRKILSVEADRKKDLSKKVEILRKLKSTAFAELMKLGIPKTHIELKIQHSHGVVNFTFPVEEVSCASSHLTPLPLLTNDKDEGSVPCNIPCEQDSAAMPNYMNEPNIISGPSFTNGPVTECVEPLENSFDQRYSGSTTPANSELSQSEKDILMQLVDLENIETTSLSNGPYSTGDNQGFGDVDSTGTNTISIPTSLASGDNQVFSFTGDDGSAMSNPMSIVPCVSDGDTQGFDLTDEDESAVTKTVSLSPCLPDGDNQVFNLIGSDQSDGITYTMSSSSCTDYSMSPLNYPSGFYNQPFSLNQALGVCM